MRDFLIRNPAAPIMLAMLIVIAVLGTSHISCEVRIHSTTQPSTQER